MACFWATLIALAGGVEWQTRGTQNALPSRACGFKSRLRHSLDRWRHRVWCVWCQDVGGAADTRMVALGFGKFARADRIYALERITGEERGDGHRTRVWIDGVADPLIASRTEVTILRDMGQESAIVKPELDEALDLAARLAAAADEGRVDLSDLGRRARRLLASTTEPGTDRGGRDRGRSPAKRRHDCRGHTTPVAGPEPVEVRTIER